MLRLRSVSFVVAIVFATTTLALVQDHPKKPADKPAAKPADASKPADAKSGDKPAAGGAPDMSAMMEGVQAMSAPGKEHEALKPMVGSFNCTTKIHMPGQAPVESTGTIERKWILGNRYIAEEVKSSMMGMPFEGFGIAGYDKLQKFYHVYWVDTFGTGTWTMTGTADASGKIFSFTGENFDPMTMTKKKGRSTTEIISNDKHTMKMYDTGPDGKEYVAFEMSCTRK